MAMIIAMKGHPGTGKSTIATAIAKALRIPLVDKDDIRDATLSVQLAGESRDLLNDLSYDATWRVAATQLRLGLSVVIDSPQSRRAHLDSLLGLVPAERVVIIECGPRDEAEWRCRIERRAPGWHKPATWREMEGLLEGYRGCTEYDVGAVRRIVVDTTADGVSLEETVLAVLGFIRSCGGPSLDLEEWGGVELNV